jgi:hypothetical protein
VPANSETPSPADVIAEIEVKLQKYSDVSYESTQDSITVHAQEEDGFAVACHVDDESRFTVSFDGWHETFRTPVEALNCFAFGLSGECRLVVELRGQVATKWIVQSKRDGSWVTDSEVGLILIPFWRRKRIVYRQNRFAPFAV